MLNLLSSGSSLAPMRAAEAAEHVGAGGRDVDMPVLGPEDAGRDAGRMVVAGLLRHLAGDEIARRLEVEHGDLRLEQRGLHPLPLARFLALQQGDEDADGAIHPRGQIGDRDADPHRPLAGQAGDRHEPAHALRDLIEAGTAAIGTVLAEAGDAAIDDARIDRAQRLVVDAEAMLDVGAVVLDQHVGLRRHAPQDLLARLLLQVEGQAALVAVEVLEIEAVPLAAELLLAIAEPPPRP